MPAKKTTRRADPLVAGLKTRLSQVEKKLDLLLAGAGKAPANASKQPVPAPGANEPAGAELGEDARLQTADHDTVEYLTRNPLFAKHTAQECALIAGYLDAKFLPKDKVLFQQGDVGDAMYLVKTGALEIYKNDVFGPLRIAEIRPGGLVGEMALVENKPRSANIRASEDSKLLALSRGAYMDLKKLHPQVATKFQDELLLLLSGRLRQTTEKLVGNK